MGDRLRAALEQLIPNHDHLFEERPRQGADARHQAQGAGGPRDFVAHLRDNHGLLTVAAGENVVPHAAAAGDRREPYRRVHRAAVSEARAELSRRRAMTGDDRATSSTCPTPAATRSPRCSTTRSTARRRARAGRRASADADAPLAGHTLAMIFEKNSTRTRVSFDMAIRQLGGTLDRAGRGHHAARPRRDRRRHRARARRAMVDAIMIRTDDHAKIEEMARHASVPVINGLTDASHPCQIIADLLTVIEQGKALPGLEVGLARRRQQCAPLDHRGGRADEVQRPHRLRRRATIPIEAFVERGTRARRARSRSTRDAARGGRRAPTSSSPTPGSRWARSMPTTSSRR